MEKRIYVYLAAIMSITMLVTQVVLSFLIKDYYSGLANPGSVSIWEIFIAMIPAMIGILVFLLVILFVLSSKLTHMILAPIKRATDNIESILSGKKVQEASIYPEVRPFIQTIDHQKRQIDMAINELREAEKIRREFTANVSHELKTPLTSINGFAEMIASGSTSKDDTIKFAGIIHKEGTRLLNLIEDIISLSRLDGAPRGQVFEELQLDGISEGIIRQLMIRAQDKDIDLQFRGEPVLVKGDSRMIEDLIYNLVDNGIKYTESGGKVALSVFSSSGEAIIEVSDTGIGIPNEDQSRIFERFYQVDKSRSKKVGGSGLGLSIVKHIVQSHGGSINLKSSPGNGTTITVKLPK
ncbi:sensor histidine kinase [Gudongella sp. SC589]|jgi:two-component system phosphate regulon sensor histidine kinase PhoR|uniref:sensor histidine kinase n=1 Tax=Gudongella sp. SC589 TaxID=3385990 RepID=UPI003904D5DE